ncbi:MAG: SLC13 family permease [Planctomycetota bacterium]|nr:SLC13 family permease [Planctomycetota bacterium]
MDLHGWIALATLVLATILLITRWIPIAITGLSIPVVLVTTGVIREPKDALVGFGNSAVIAIGGIFVIGAALRESGVATLIARGLQRVAGRNEVGILTLMMAATVVLAAFMNNTAVVAILLPVGVVLAQRSGVAASRLLLPLSFAAVLGGTISLIGTAPNFIVADHYNTHAANVAHAAQYPGSIGVFDYAFVGIPIAITGILFMVLIGRRLLPTITTSDRIAAAQLPEQVASNYGVPNQLFTLKLVDSSSIVGRTIADSGIRNTYGLDVVMVRRPAALGPRWFQPEPGLELEADDVLYVSGDDAAAWELCETELLQFGLAEPGAVGELLGHGTTLAEVTLTPHSPAIGRTFRHMDFRKRFGVNVLALFRRQAVMRENLADIPLELGDAFVASGTPRSVRALSAHPDFVVLTDQTQVEDVTRAPLAVALLLLALLPPVFWNFPLPISAIGAALLMIMTRCISQSGLRRCMDWSVLCLLVGTMPLGLALEQQGIAAHAATALTGLSHNPTLLFAALFSLGAIFSNLASNAAAAVIMAPVAAQVAFDVPGIDTKSALLAMAYGCSCNFIVPYSQCNLLVMAPGGYQARDFIRVGLAASVVMAVTTILALEFL